MQIFGWLVDTYFGMTAKNWLSQYSSSPSKIMSATLNRRSTLRPLGYLVQKRTSTALRPMKGFSFTTRRKMNRAPKPSLPRGHILLHVRSTNIEPHDSFFDCSTVVANAAVAYAEGCSPAIQANPMSAGKTASIYADHRQAQLCISYQYSKSPL
jgi:hypothetical protein